MPQNANAVAALAKIANKMRPTPVWKTALNTSANRHPTGISAFGAAEFVGAGAALHRVSSGI